MTRNSDLRLEDIAGCQHTPEIPIVDDCAGEILYWVCRCGRRCVTPIVSTQSKEPDPCPKT
jgi:hypothetical protein